MKIKTIILLIATVFMGCGSHREPQERGLAELCDSLTALTDSVKGEVGIALIADNSDTMVVNNRDVYPMMSVFKLHQAIALCHRLESDGRTIDSVLQINRSTLNPNTWSPMYKEQQGESFSLSLRELMRYTLASSDNNASNLMFDRVNGVAQTDSFIATIIPRNGFGIGVREHDMQLDHSLSYANHTSPLSAAMLMNRLFTDRLLTGTNRRFIQQTLTECSTGTDRIVAPLINRQGVKVAHKTGSGYRNEQGRLIAHNDVAFVSMPGGRHYALAVFVKDFDGDEQQASAIIARISAIIYTHLANSK